ncbi:sulfurtransferase [Stutzerimonas kirkiae]|uniref:Sulfurtransferase n=1 Tax=Stutzerimonas kirkiae TaxID=2211392 RepID=A0A4Q9R5N1_9GAMM|nr:sulfurtransferase [Stutzerimonas kirkiae]TBU94813.1 sulfurtransferase [Stutzerimonas kirkiae]TBV01859.1 sulfurtransferase [Stutzerimonas kirkiae]
MSLARPLIAALLYLAASGLQASPLVDSAWLEKHLHDDKVKILEVSMVPEQFDFGHIPGAHNLDWHTDLVDPLRRDIASRDALQALLRKAGVSRGDTLVLYGDNHNWFAAWGVWVLETYGLGNVKLLDGGRVKWEAEGRPLTREARPAEPGDLALSPLSETHRARLADVVAIAEGKAPGKLVDIRSPAEYQGQVIAPPGSTELSMRAGHIPGAVNVPWGELVNEDGTFKSVDELRRIYQAVGIDGSTPIVTYCRIGERSSHSWFALARLLGYPTRNYDGSWTEYGNAVGVPIDNPSGQVWRGL